MRSGIFKLFMFFLAFAFVAGGATVATAVATTAFSLYLFVNQPADNTDHRNGYHHYDGYIKRSHKILLTKNYSSSFFFLRLKILSISNLPIFLKTIKVTTKPITASQINSVHHQLPTV